MKEPSKGEKKPILPVNWTRRHEPCVIQRPGLTITLPKAT